MKAVMLKCLKKVNKINILRVLTFCMIFFVQFTIILVNYLAKYGIIFNVRAVNMAIPIYICLPFLLGVYLYDLFKNKRKLNVYDFIFFALVITGLISSINAVDVKLSFFGSEHRNRGFFTVLSYYLLFINWKVNGTTKDIKWITNTIIYIGFLNCMYALLQVYTDYDFILRFADWPKMATGFCGNPNFFGTLMAVCLGFLTYYLLTEKITIKRMFLYLLFIISLINGQSTGAILTFVIVTIFLVIYFLRKKCLPIRKFLILLSFVILIPAMYFITININTNYFDNDHCELCEIKKTIKSGGTGRTYIWGHTMGVVKNNWLVGVGYDNLRLVYPLNGLSRRNVDDAHNEYLQLLISTGVVGVIPYMLLLLITFIKGIRSKNKYMFLLFSGFLAYSIQAVVNLSVIQIAPIYYVIIGLMLSINEKEKALE